MDGRRGKKKGREGWKGPKGNWPTEFGQARSSIGCSATRETANAELANIDVERPEGMRIETRKNIGYKIFLLSSLSLPPSPSSLEHDYIANQPLLSPPPSFLLPSPPL